MNGDTHKAMSNVGSNLSHWSSTEGADGDSPVGSVRVTESLMALWYLHWLMWGNGFAPFKH